MVTLQQRERVMRLLREPHRVPAAVRRRLPNRRPAAPAPQVEAPTTKDADGPARTDLTRLERRKLITAAVDLTGLGLEIGPSHNPLLPKTEGFDIRTADHLDQSGLVEKYSGMKPTTRIESVDYVITSACFADGIPERFDYIVGSHVAEHTVCLISFLRDCGRLLKPGGVLTLALPDKRYCFDRFRERTSLGRVIDVYRAAPAVHTEGSVTEHYLTMVNKGGVPSWSAGAPGPYSFRYQLGVPQQHAASAASGTYVDTHNWVLTPNHFRLLIADLHLLGFIALREHTFHDTVNHEFFITMKNDAEGPGLSRAELLVAAAREVAEADVGAFG